MGVKEVSAAYIVERASAVPQGYKQTEVGMIPEDWEVRMLRKISPGQSVGLVINPSTYYSDAGEIPLLVGSNIRENSIDWISARRITDTSNKKIPASRLDAGDIVMVRVGEPGTSAVVPPEIDGCNCASMMIIRKHNSFCSLWLCYLMNSNIGRVQVENVQYGTAQKQFNISDAINFIYPFPSLLEQEAIAEALSDADALIESLEQLITKKRHLKQGTMQELLTGKKRLPGFESQWESGLFAQIADKIVGGGTPSRQVDRYWGGSIPWMTVKDFAHGSKVETIESITKEGLKNSASNLIPKSTLIISTRMAVGRATILEIDVSINQDLKAIFPVQDVNELFLYYWFQLNEEKIAGLGSGSTVAGLALPDLRKIPFSKPTLKEQTAIATILSDMDAEITTLETRLAKARAIKQGMMQELLTGRIRLVDVPQ